MEGCCTISNKSVTVRKCSKYCRPLRWLTGPKRPPKNALPTTSLTVKINECQIWRSRSAWNKSPVPTYRSHPIKMRVEDAKVFLSFNVKDSNPYFCQISETNLSILIFSQWSLSSPAPCAIAAKAGSWGGKALSPSEWLICTCRENAHLTIAKDFTNYFNKTTRKHLTFEKTLKST